MVLAPLLACAREAPSPPPPPPAWSPPPVGTTVTVLPPIGTTPPVLLEVGPLAPGIDVAFTVRNVAPGETVYVGWSEVGPGEGPCPPELAGGCLDLVDPAPLLGPGRADLSLTATIVHRWTGDRGPQFLQAAVRRLDGSVATSPVLERRVYEPDEVQVGDAVSSELLPGIRALTGALVVDGPVALPELEQIGGDLVAWEQDQLDALGLPALELVGGDLSLYDDPALTSLSGLSALRSIGDTLSINRMPGLTDLRGLERLRTIGGTLYVFHDVELRSLDGLGALELVGGAVELWEDYALVSAELPALRIIGTKLDLFEDDALVTLRLPQLAQLGAFELHHCDRMTDVGELPMLERLPGELRLQYDAALGSVDGLPALGSVGAALIRFNSALGSLGGLSSLERVDGALEVYGNRTLADPGLAALAEVGGEVVFTDNPALSQCALDALFDRIDAAEVRCGGNLDDGCAGWCQGDTGP